MSQVKTVGTVKSAGLRFLWEVKNFCMCSMNIGDVLISPVHSTSNTSTDQKWLLQLYPKGYEEKDWMSIFVQYMGNSDVDVDITLSLLNDKNCQVAECKFKRQYKKGSFACGTSEFIRQDFVTDKRNRVLVNDTINILCEIIYDSNLAEPLKEKFKSEASLSYCRLKEFDEFEKLLEDKNSTSDVTMRIGKDEIKAHKAIIMSRSPVFRAMFEHDMKEKEQSIVEITDIKYEVMKEVVRFMYIGKVNGIDEIASDLLIAAEKYSMKGLKVLCETKLFENLALTNAVEYLKLADMYNADNLKTKIIQFIIPNQKDIINQPKFELLPSKVVCKILRTVFNSDNEEVHFFV